MRVLKYYVKIKHYLRHENKVNEVLSCCEAVRYMLNIIKTMKKLFSIMSNLQTYYINNMGNHMVVVGIISMQYNIWIANLVFIFHLTVQT